MNRTGNGVRRYQLILGASIVAATAIYLLVVHQMGIEGDVVSVYFPYADELVHGSIPETGYPPFALVLIAIPRLFASTPSGYEAVFAVMVCAFLLAGLVATGKLAKRYYQSQHMAMLTYVVLMLLMFEFVMDRIDIFPVILTLLSLYCLVTKRYAWAFVLLSIASVTNLYPAVLLPVYLIPFLLNRDWANMLKGAGAFFFTALLILLPFALIGPDAAFHFLSHNMDYPLQVESVAASIIAFASILGLTGVSVMHDPILGADLLVGAWPDALAPWLIPLTLSVLVALYVICAYKLSEMRKDKQDNENNRMLLLGGAALLSLLVFIIFGKALFSQYMLLVIPFVVFMQMMSIDRISKRYILGITIAAILLTQLNFAVNICISGGGADITDAGMMIILARNIVAVILFIYVAWTCKKALERRPWRSQPDGD